MKYRAPIIGSMIASVGAVLGASCCVIPLVFFNLGMSGAWLTHLAVLQPLRPYLIALSIMAFVAGLSLYRRSNKEACCEPARPSKKLMVLFAFTGLLTAAAIIWPWVDLKLLHALR